MTMQRQLRLTRDGGRVLACGWFAVVVLATLLGGCGLLPAHHASAPAVDPAQAAGVKEAAMASAVAAAKVGGPEEEILSFSLHMDTTDADVLFKKDMYDTSSFPVQLVGEGGRLLSGRVEVKGSFSRRFPKKSILVKLDKGGTWQGMRRISLNAMGTDPTLMREFLIWDLFRNLGMATPRVQYARLFINDQFAGLFLFIEWIEPRMFGNFGLGSDGALYHPRDSAFCGDLTPASLAPDKECWLKLAPPDNNFSELTGLVQGLATTPAADFAAFLDQHFDVDSVLNWIAGNVLTSNGDTYNKNYFLYLSRKTGKWTVEPWDYDLTYGRAWDPGLPFPASIYNDNFQYMYPPNSGLANPLKDKLFANPELYRRFKRRLGHLLGVTAPDPAAPAATYGWFAPERLAKRLDAVEQRIGADVARDAFVAEGTADRESMVAALRYYCLARYLFLKTMVFDKTAYGTSRWTPEMAALGMQEINALPVPPAGARIRLPLDLSATVKLLAGKEAVYLVDPVNFRFLATFWPQELTGVTRLNLEAQAEQPLLWLPPGKEAGQCLERSWLLTSQAPATEVTGDLRLAYFQESSLHHELGGAVTDEAALNLWVQEEGSAWRELATEVNVHDNTLTTRHLTLRPMRLYRIVACQ